MKIQSQIIVTASSAHELTRFVREIMKSGYVPLGSHTVVRVLEQKMFAGNDHKRTEYTIEYAQTMVIYKS